MQYYNTAEGHEDDKMKIREMCNSISVQNLTQYNNTNFSSSLFTICTAPKASNGVSYRRKQQKRQQQQHQQQQQQ